MPLFTKARNFVRNIFSSRSVDADLDQEVHSHLEMLTGENLRAGMPPNQAQRAARIELGGIEQLKEQVREQRLGNWLRSVLADCRYGLRQFGKNPGFTTVAVLTLALGIGVNATMFSLVSAFLLRRPPGHEPERVAVLSSVSPTQDIQSDANPVSVPNYLAWREANHSFADMAAAEESLSINLTSQGQSQALRSAVVSSNYFSVLGVSPELGRAFSDGEDQAGRDRVVILSHDLWERQFGSDVSLVGRTIRLNRENYIVIGVMPASFRLLGYTPQVWTPLVITAENQTEAARKDRTLVLFARLKPRVSIEQASAELATLARLTQGSFPDAEKGWGAMARTLPDFLVYNFGIRTALAVVMATVGFVLMMACANVAGLLLARAAGRRKELGIRIALGAGRFRIVRQLLTENLMIAFLGGAVGLLLAYGGTDLLGPRLNFNEAISAVPLRIDWNVAWFAVAVSLLCAVLCGIAPALNASRTDINTSLKDESRAASSSRSHSRLRAIMVTGEIALALILLIGTGLLFRGIYQIEHQNLGFQPENLLTASVTLDDARYKDTSKQRLFVQDLIPRLQRIPGTEAVAVASDLPATWPSQVPLQIRGRAEVPGEQRLTALDTVVTTDYFRVAGIPLLHGRTFTETDNATAPHVVLVNQEFADRHLHGQQPLGQQIRLDVGGSTSDWSEIVGVVANVKTYSELTRNDPAVYEAFLQRPINAFSLMLRTSADPNGAASALRNSVAQVDADLPLDRVISMPALIERQRAGNPLFVQLLASFAVLALLLSAIGIYGLVAYSVSQRTHEIGIRVALGARTGDVVHMVLREGLKMAAIGIVIGIALALPLPKLFDAIFYGAHFREPRLYFIVPVAILVVTMLATYIPARRASRVDPMSALRQE